eukprot:gene31604-36175_t
MGQRPSLSDASRPSQRVDYSSYVHDDDGIPFIENKLPHDTHPENAEAAKPSAQPQTSTSFFGKILHAAPSFLLHSGTDGHHSEKEAPKSGKDSSSASKNGENRSARVILLKESQRASQRVDYSTYVHDEDEGDMHYADNILPHDLHHKEDSTSEAEGVEEVSSKPKTRS